MNDLDKIKDLLGSEDPINRELGIVLALSQGMSLDELVDKCYNDKWLLSRWRPSFDYFDTKLGNYELTENSWNNYDIYDIRNWTRLEQGSKTEGFRRLVIIFLQDNYPELLNKINNK